MSMKGNKCFVNGPSRVGAAQFRFISMKWQVGWRRQPLMLLLLTRVLERGLDPPPPRVRPEREPVVLCLQA